jgi:hypothetical protein
MHPRKDEKTNKMHRSNRQNNGHSRGLFIIGGLLVLVIFFSNKHFRQKGTTTMNFEDFKNLEITYKDCSLSNEAPTINLRILDTTYRISDSVHIALPVGIHPVHIHLVGMEQTKFDTIHIEHPKDNYEFYINYKSSDNFRKQSIEFFYNREVSQINDLDSVNKNEILERISNKYNALVDSFQKHEVFHTYSLNRSKIILN